MARSISIIHAEIMQRIAADPNLAGLSSTSKVAMYRLFAYIVAFSIWTLEMMYDTHRAEVVNLLLTQKSGRLPWYRTMALRFQFGFTLETDSDYFFNGVADAEMIEASKIVKYAAVVESEESSRVIIKIAGAAGEVLQPITSAQEAAFIAYINEVKWAGVQVEVVNFLPDKLSLTLQIKRDPLLLESDGTSILYGNNPVVDALKEFMRELPFDGDLRLSALVDKLQAVEGVLDATVLYAQSAWIDAELGGYGFPTPIYISKVPVSGYFEIENFDTIVYVV